MSGKCTHNDCVRKALYKPYVLAYASEEVDPDKKRPFKMRFEGHAICKRCVPLLAADDFITTENWYEICRAVLDKKGPFLDQSRCWLRWKKIS